MKKFENEIFSLNRIKFSELLTDTNNFIAKTYNDIGQYFSNASPFGQILRVILNLSQMIFYYIEDSISELNIHTASRADSVKGLARIAGHNSTRAIAATGDLKFMVTGDAPDMFGTDIVIPNHTKIGNGNNGLTYTIISSDDAIRLSSQVGTSTIVHVMQGIFDAQTFTGTGYQLQSFNAAVKNSTEISNDNVRVFVNSEEWKIYKSLYDIPRDKKGCIVKTGITSGIDVYFGNKNFGMIPTAGSLIRIEYYTTSGFAGNIQDNSNIQWSVLDPVYDTSGNEVDINSIVTYSIEKSINFGADAEDIEFTRIIAPNQSRSFVLANPDNYIIFLDKMNQFSSVNAYNTKNDNYIDDDNVIYLFILPDINKNITTNENYFSVSLDGFILDADEKDKIIELIDKSGERMVTAVEKIIDPVIKRYILNISLITFEGFDVDTIKASIVSDASYYLLNNTRRDRIPKSDLIRIIENVPGVDSVNVSFVSQLNELNQLTSTVGSADKLIGLDSFGDIIMGVNDLVLIRGGWKDRNGIFYEDTDSQDKLSSINISVNGNVKVNYNTLKQKKTMDDTLALNSVQNATF